MAKGKKIEYYYGTGRRKRAIARVRLIPGGSGKMTVNNKEVIIEEALTPIVQVGKTGSYDISVRVSGGGSVGQIEAIRLGVARALLEVSTEFRSILKKLGFLTRDPREKERKKYGLKSARRGPQFAKR